MNKWVIVVVVIAVVVVGGYFFATQNSINIPPSDGEVSDWRTFELTDIRTGEKFSVSDFGDKPILLESFAVWCPTCTRQQEEIKEFHKLVGNSVISISLNVDPNEDPEMVLEHVEKNGFDWFYAVSPIGMTQALIAEFGQSFIDAPSAPVILICPDGSARKLGRGVKNAEKLQLEIESCF